MSSLSFFCINKTLSLCLSESERPSGALFHVLTSPSLCAVQFVSHSSFSLFGLLTCFVFSVLSESELFFCVQCFGFLIVFIGNVAHTQPSNIVLL